ncbi:putative RING-H2 zinc finger protein RHA1a [Iris pallida]|uniref:RING-H2 zinc finger protein RHA1a n=1 Tax=Iris pallida TaxID=29817 RepID=A0AAX6EKZ1_IRIPA|nr:putative RING-H2 zinc finger protein RHA1a [Iris pallida]
MGFPMGYAYTELLFPKLLLHLVFLLGYVRRLISWAFDKAGLGDLVDSDEQQQESSSLHPEFPPASSSSSSSPAAALLIEEVLPVVLYKELSDEEERCAVCLYEVEAADEVRRLSNCRHVFHKGCLDRWIGHDHQRTCPLCRTPLFPDDTPEEAALDERFWEAARLPDSSSSHHHHFLF